MGCASERPLSGCQIIHRQIRSSLDKTFRVEHDTTIEPARVGDGASHDEDVRNVVGLDVASAIVAPAHSFQIVVVALEGY